MDSPTGSSCKTGGYLGGMIVVLILLVAALVFGLWYYFAQLKPRIDMLVMDKMTGAVGFKDSTNAQLLLQPPLQATTGQSSRLTIVNPITRSNLDFSLYTMPIPNNTKQQTQLYISSKQGSGVIPLTG